MTATEDIFEPLVMSFQNKDNVEKLNLQSVDLHHIFDKKLVNFYSNAIQNIIKENKHEVFYSLIETKDVSIVHQEYILGANRDTMFPFGIPQTLRGVTFLIEMEGKKEKTFVPSLFSLFSPDNQIKLNVIKKTAISVWKSFKAGHMVVRATVELNCKGNKYLYIMLYWLFSLSFVFITFDFLINMCFLFRNILREKHCYE